MDLHICNHVTFRFLLKKAVFLGIDASCKVQDGSEKVTKNEKPALSVEITTY
jgi:hypothetical protein